MSRCLALAVLLAAAPASAAPRGRLVLSLLAGGGYTSDVFVGAGLGPDAILQVTPAARLDLALAPRWKLAAVADATYGSYLSSQVTSLVESGAIEGRWLGGPAWEASLALGGEHGSYSAGSPLDPSLVASPTISSTVEAHVSPLVRVRALGLEWRVAGFAGARTSTAAGTDVPERDYAALAGAMWPIGAGASLAGTYKLAHADSTRVDFAMTSHAIFALASWRVEPVDLEAQLQLQTASFATGARENLGRLTLRSAVPIAGSVDLEAVYSFAANQSNDPTRPSATRHLAFLALRWRFAEVGW